MNALQKLWVRLEVLLTTDELVALQEQYRADAAEDSRASRRRSKERTDQAKAQRERQAQIDAILREVDLDRAHIMANQFAYWRLVEGDREIAVSPQLFGEGLLTLGERRGDSFEQGWRYKTLLDATLAAAAWDYPTHAAPAGWFEAIGQENTNESATHTGTVDVQQ